MLAKGTGSTARSVGRAREIDPGHRRDGIALALLGLAVVIAASSWFDAARPVGAWVDSVVRIFIGSAVVVLPVVTAAVAVLLMRTEPNPEARPRLVLGAAMMALPVLGLWHLWAGSPQDPGVRQHAAGFLGFAIGGPLSIALLQMDGILGLAGWKWLFIMVSLPCVLLGFVVLKVLADRPDEASWLNKEESSALKAMLAAETTASCSNALKPTASPFGDTASPANNFGPAIAAAKAHVDDSARNWRLPMRWRLDMILLLRSLDLSLDLSVARSCYPRGGKTPCSAMQQ